MKYEFIKCEHIYEIKLLEKTFFNNKFTSWICVGAISWPNCQWNEFFYQKKFLEHKFFTHLFLWIFFTKIYLLDKICNDDFFSKKYNAVCFKKNSTIINFLQFVFGKNIVANIFYENKLREINSSGNFLYTRQRCYAFQKRSRNYKFYATSIFLQKNLLAKKISKEKKVWKSYVPNSFLAKGINFTDNLAKKVLQHKYAK